MRPSSAGTADGAAPAARAFADAPLFAGVPADAVAALASTARLTHLRAREWLFREGDRPDELFVIASGRLRVVASAGGQERVLRVVGAGALLGELGVLTRSQRSASVQAIRDSTVAAVDAERFLTAVESNSEVAAAIAVSLARLLQESGGLLPPAAPQALFGLVPLEPTPQAESLCESLRRAFAPLGSVGTIDDAQTSDRADYARIVDAAEATHEYVLLTAGAGSNREWQEFVARQSDRTLVVAEARTRPAEPVPPHLQGADVVFAGAPDAATIGRFLDAFGSPRHHIVPAGDDGAAARVVRRLTRRSLGVVLSGGGARGFAHIGALEALAQAGFAIDRVGGCSIGSFIGAMAARGWGADRIVAVCEAELVRRAPFGDYRLPRVSLTRGSRAAAMLRRVFGDLHVEELSRPYFAVSADLIGSELVVHRRGRLFDAVGASMSIPGVAPPLPLGSRLLVDGGVLNNLPVDLMAESDEGAIVAIDVIRRMEGGGTAAQMRVLSIMEILSRATVLASVERAERNRKLAALTIAPEVQSIALGEFSQLRRAAELGRRAAEDALASGGADKLRAALSL